jgi:hypothetical protein
MNRNLTDQKFHFCDVCVQAKMKRLPFNGQLRRANYPMEIIHSDTIILKGLESFDGYKHAYVYVHDYTRLSSVYLSKEKTTATQFESLKNNLQFCEIQQNNRGKTSICQNGVHWCTKPQPVAIAVRYDH